MKEIGIYHCGVLSQSAFAKTVAPTHDWPDDITQLYKREILLHSSVLYRARATVVAAFPALAGHYTLWAFPASAGDYAFTGHFQLRLVIMPSLGISGFG